MFTARAPLAGQGTLLLRVRPRVDLEDGRFRCLRVSASPFLGDDRLCAVLEPFTAASDP